MTKISGLAAAAAIALTVSACSGNDAPDGDAVTETQMDEVDVIDGTISDDMVDVDTIQEVDATGEKEEEEKETTSDDASEPAAEEEAATDNPAE